jgi:hypothetical protein
MEHLPVFACFRVFTAYVYIYFDQHEHIPLNMKKLHEEKHLLFKF